MFASCVPAVVFAAPAGEQRAAVPEVPIIDVTVPTSFILGGDAGIDIQDLGEVSATSSFVNNSNTAVRIKQATCDAAGLNSYFDVKDTNIAALSLSGQQITWVPNKSENESIYDASEDGAQEILFNTTDTQKDVTLTLNMTDMGLKDKVIEATKNRSALRDLMKMSWIFEMVDLGFVPDGTVDDDFYLKIKDDATHPDLIEHAGEVFSLSNISEMADDIAVKGTASEYYPMFSAMVTDVTTTANYDASDVAAGQYECKVKWNDGADGAPTSYDVRVIGINHDNLSTPTDDYTEAGLTFQFVNCLNTAYAMNASDINSGGWANTELRTNLNTGTIWNTIPAAQQNAFKTVKKYYNPTYNSTSAAVSVSNDKVFIASYCELGGNNQHSSFNNRPWIDLEGYQYEYWKAKDATGQNVAQPVLAKGYQSNPASAVAWWERSVSPIYSYYFLFVSIDGYPSNYGNASYTSGVCPAFCL